MKVCVTGDAGMQGTALCAHLVRQGHEVIGIDRTPRKAGAGWPHYQLDCSSPDKSLYYAMTQCDALVHLAADLGNHAYISRMGGSLLLHNNAIDNAVFGVANALRIPRIVYASSACVYRATARPPGGEAAALDEDDRLEPDCQYGMGKLAGEMLLAYMDTPVKIAMRLFNVYGRLLESGKRVVDDLVIRAMNERAGGTLQLLDDGSAYRSLLYVDDAIEAYQKALTADVTMGFTTVNIGHDTPCTVRGLADVICGVSGKRLSVCTPEGSGGGADKVPKVTKASVALDWRPTTSLKEGVRRVWQANTIELKPRLESLWP